MKVRYTILQQFVVAFLIWLGASKFFEITLVTDLIASIVTPGFISFGLAIWFGLRYERRVRPLGKRVPQFAWWPRYVGTDSDGHRYYAWILSGSPRYHRRVRKQADGSGYRVIRRRRELPIEVKAISLTRWLI